MLRTFLRTLAIGVLFLTVTPVFAAVNAPEGLTLQPPDGMKATKTFVTFPHGRHVKSNLECVTCHHTWDGKAEIKSCSSTGCHDQSGKKGEKAFYTAFHSRKNDRSCLGCHKAQKKAGLSVPVSCKSCHPK